MKEFESLKIPQSALSNGIVFIWIEKEYIMPVIKHFEKQDLNYIENVCWVQLDRDKKKDQDIHSTDLNQSINLSESSFLKRSHKTLLMFRR